MLQCSTSLWSADLANLEAEIRRMEPYTDRFHFDVTDGQYVKELLFFPDLVKALRKHTTLPFEVHLIASEPIIWIQPFVEAGADIIIFCFDATGDPARIIKTIKGHGRQAGISLRIREPIDLLQPFWQDLDIVTIVGTPMGTKGVPMDASIPDKIRRVKELIIKRGLQTKIVADGGIRRDTVPLVGEAGADFIVAGSLMFNEDPGEIRRWLGSL